MPRSTSSTAYTRAARTREDDALDVRCNCPNNRRAVRRRSGPTARNPLREFYTCPLGMNDDRRCKFFKWADEAEASAAVRATELTPGTPITPSRGNRLGSGSGTRAGAGAGAGLGAWFSPRGAEGTPTKSRAGGTSGTAGMAGSATASTETPRRRLVSPPRDASPDDGIDWASVDADSLEADAEARTPHRSQNTPGQAAAGAGAGVAGAATVKPGTPAHRLADRLAAVAGKRKREDDEETPRKQGNPFVDTTPRGPVTPARAGVASVPGSGASGVSLGSAAEERGTHPALAPVVLSLEGLGEHLARQDRLVRAAEAMKKSMRQTIQNLQERVRELEAENEALRKEK